MGEKPPAPCSATSAITAVSVESTVAAFVVLIAGVVASVSVLSFELGKMTVRRNLEERLLRQGILKGDISLYR